MSVIFKVHSPLLLELVLRLDGLLQFTKGHENPHPPSDRHPSDW